MTPAAAGRPASRQLQHRGPPLHPLEVRPTPRRRYQLALALQLLSAAGILAAGTGLVVPATGSALPLVGALLAAAGWVGAHTLRRRAWAGLPPPERRAAMPATDDRRYARAAALLLMLWAAGISALGPAGAFLAAVIGLDAAVTAAGSWRWLAGHAPDPARRVPALLTAAAVSWTASATVGGLGGLGGLGVQGVPGVVSGVGLLLAAGHGLLALTRRAAGR